MTTRRRFLASTVAAASGLATTRLAAQAGPDSLLNVSYDVSREFFRDLNAAFVARERSVGRTLRIEQSHGGSSAQARAVADGLAADVVTFNTTTDVDFLAERGVVAADWRQRFPHGAVPTTSTMLFLVRQGNPKGIRDWADLVKPGVQVIVVNPKTGGNGRMAYLAAWGAVRDRGGSEADALDFVTRLYRSVPVLARGGRDATGVFLQRNIGDVLITFESEVISVDREFGSGRVDAIHPSASLLTENPVAVVERTVTKRGSAELARRYLEFLYTPEGQEIAARHNIRPRSDALLRKYANVFRPLRLFSIEQHFGSLAEAQRVHFNDGGVFDRIYTPGRAA
jgi:sulfate transport system substrate-binding protein